MDAYAPAADTMYIATITEINEPRVYIMQGQDSAWKLQERKYYPNNPSAAPQNLGKSASMGATIDSAKDWTFNPFGDIKLGLVEGDLVFWIGGVATVAPARTGLLYNKSEETTFGWLRSRAYQLSNSKFEVLTNLK
jgi:hypothetical protein